MAEPDLIAYVEAPSPTACLVQGQILGYQELQRIITYHRLRRDYPLRNNIFAFNASRTRFFPFQFKPLVKFLDSPRHRLLVCDEVGLGKTIESGLILIELRARQDLRTVLVLCPAGLRDKWRLELRRRFGEDFRILGAKDFDNFLDDYEEAPDRVTLNGIISYETIRSKRLLDRLEDMLPAFDVVIADEAHHMRNFGVRARRAGVALSATAGAMILLTATPVHLGDENLFSLLNLLDDEDFRDLGLARLRFEQNELLVRAQRYMGLDPPGAQEALECLRVAANSPWLAAAPALPRVLADLTTMAVGPAVSPTDRHRQLQIQRDLADLNLLGHIFTRTRKRDVQADVARRKAKALEVCFTKQEQDFYDAVSNIVYKRAAARGQMPVIVQWQLNAIQRRLSSSIHAMVDLIRRDGVQAVLGDPESESVPEEAENQQAGGGIGSALATVNDLVHGWHQNAEDSKFAAVHKLLTELRGERKDFKLVIFAFFRETLVYLNKRLAQVGVQSSVLHGGVPVEERPSVIARFETDPTVHVLLSSRVGSEGLDFQFCDTLVNYDLPWNPMEVEQRIGRLDRIGQRAAIIHIVNLWTHGTIEERILRRLFERIGVFERSIGSLDPILGDVIQELERTALGRHLSQAEASREADRIASVLLRQAQDAERLERDAERFVGADEYFNEEVAAVRSNRRYVTGPQLRRFLEDFLLTHAPGTRLRYDSGSDHGVLIPDRTLRQFLQAQRAASDLVHVLAAGKEGVRITFSAEAAFDDPSIEFINVLHPLITAIVESYEQAVGERISAQAVRLRTERLTPGIYVFVVYRLSVLGARTRHTIESVFVDSGLQAACDADTAEAILGEIVESGEDQEGGGPVVPPDVTAAAVRSAQEVFLARQQEIRLQLERENDAFVERRRTSVRQSYDKNIGRLQMRLEQGQARGRQERYLGMLRGQLARLEGERLRKMEELDRLRMVQVEHTEVTAGVLEAYTE